MERRHKKKKGFWFILILKRIDYVNVLFANFEISNIHLDIYIHIYTNLYKHNNFFDYIQEMILIKLGITVVMKL